MNVPHSLFAALCGVVVLTAAALSTAVSAENQDEASSGPPPLVIDKEAPLLLEEPTEAEKRSLKSKPQRFPGNDACFVCHMNYKEEALANRHAEANVGCVECHGTSYPHRNDENNITPPDIMYPADQIDASCVKCHTTHDAPAVQVIVRWIERCAAKRDPKALVCTDCHGNHRLKIRTVRWDKRTGKLVRAQPPEGNGSKVVPRPRGQGNEK
jgi:hypothetical protein